MYVKFYLLISRNLRLKSVCEMPGHYCPCMVTVNALIEMK